MPGEPLFFPSIGNKYIFRCKDGIHIDGNDRWLSKAIYKSCAARDRFEDGSPFCDTSWLTPHPINPLNVGQYVNNRTRRKENNVIYQESELTWTLSQPPRLWSLGEQTWSSSSLSSSLAGRDPGVGDRERSHLLDLRDLSREEGGFSMVICISSLGGADEGRVRSRSSSSSLLR